VPLFSEIESGPLRARALFLGREVLIVSRKGSREAVELFDLAKDPGQRTDLAAGGGGSTAARMRALLEKGFEAQEAAAMRRERKPFDDETRQALEALGYTGK
jgi:uroporphyrinogen-III synthase